MVWGWWFLVAVRCWIVDCSWVGWWVGSSLFHVVDDGRCVRGEMMMER